MKLTLKTVTSLALPPGKSDAIYFDEDIGGFGIRLRPGSRSWIFQYKIGGRQRRLTFGAFPALGAEDARKTASQLHARVRLGQDPAAAKLEARVAAEEAFEAHLQPYIARQRLRLRPHSFMMMERHFRVHAKPLHKLPLTKIDRRMIAALLNKIAANSGPAAANRTRASLSGFFSWAMREGLADANPVALTNRAIENASRERVLSDDELCDIWRALDGDGSYATVVRLLILTGARRQEIGSLESGEIDFDRALIMLPKEKTKNARAFEIPLSSAAMEILSDWETQGSFLFGRSASGFKGWSSCKRVLDGRIAKARAASGKTPILAWSLHDFRRTMSTRMHESLGVPPHVVEACLGHVGHQSGVPGIYNRSQYTMEKRRALEMWGEHIMAVVESRESNIVPLRA